MSEVEKLYSLAGVEKEFEQPAKCRKNPYVTCDGCMSYDDGKCLNRKDYPPFTAEKQIELIKLLSYYYNITISKNFENDYTFQCEGDDVRRYVFTSGQDFAEQLASFVNMCYELLPEEEQNEIREILK